MDAVGKVVVPMGVAAECDEVARALWDAWELRRPLVADGIDAGLPIERAAVVADSLYAALRRAGARQIGWKLGATEAAVQAALGADAPFAAPVYSTTLVAGGGPVSLGDLLAPRLEAEIAFRVVGDVPIALPCLELADCRVRGWEVSIAGAIADFGLQGRILFGAPAAHPPDLVEVVVTHDGAEVQRGSRRLTDALAGLELVRAAAGFAALDGLTIATGSIGAAIPLEPGHWRADFGALGALTLRVDP